MLFWVIGHTIYTFFFVRSNIFLYCLQQYSTTNSFSSPPSNRHSPAKQWVTNSSGRPSKGDVKTPQSCLGGRTHERVVNGKGATAAVRGNQRDTRQRDDEHHVPKGSLIPPFRGAVLSRSLFSLCLSPPQTPLFFLFSFTPSFVWDGILEGKQIYFS